MRFVLLIEYADGTYKVAEGTMSELYEYRSTISEECVCTYMRRV